MAKRRVWGAREREMFTLAAAYLSSQGEKQTDIAAKLGVNQSEVSRLLHRARDVKHWLKEAAPVLTLTKEAEALWPEAQARFAKYLSRDDLLKRLRALDASGRDRLRVVTVVRGNPANFHPSVTEAIKDVLRRGSVVGVTWGRTVRNLVDLLKETIREPIRPGDPVQFVPLCGEPLKERRDVSHYSSSMLASELHELTNGQTDTSPPSLAGVPAFIPLAYRPEEVKVIRRFIAQVAGYSIVFGEGRGRPGKVDEADTMLSSLGVADKEHRGVFLSERVALGDISEEELAATMVGDVGGVIIPAGGPLGKRQEGRLREMGERWTGLKLKHLEACADEAARTGRPGVVVLSRGSPCPGERARVVRRLVEMGLVNELIIDDELAAAL
jgi:DNA-binding transcriptional regulator LsrR (DeoR family)